MVEKLTFQQLKMPTATEMYASGSLWYARVGETFIDNWPSDLRRASIPTTMIRVDRDVMAGLFSGEQEITRSAGLLSRRLGWAMRGRPWFVRLNSRSPKDITYPGLPITADPAEAIGWLAGSERVCDDVCLLAGARRPIYICLREPVDIEPGSEARCFAKGGRLIAISRYDYQAPATSEPPTELWRSALRLHAKYLAAHYPDIVFDLCRVGGRTIILEINPYGLSDPCCFRSYEAVESVGGLVWDPPQ